MEIRTLRCFLELARLGNFTAAAEALNLTQPTLSKQMRELELELGTPLLVRGKRKTVLTEAGQYLFKNASEIIGLADRTQKNLVQGKIEIGGDVYIAGGETRAMSLIAKAMRKSREIYPGIRFHIFSGNAEAVAERLEKGLADFGTFIPPAPIEKYDYINLPMKDSWGLLLRKDHPLAEHEHISPADLSALPLICSAQHMISNEILAWMRDETAQPEIAATYNLLYNGAIMVKEGIGAALCLDGIVDISSESELCFRPLRPALKVNMVIAWKKGAIFSKAAGIFQDILRDEITEYQAGQEKQI